MGAENCNFAPKFRCQAQRRYIAVAWARLAIGLSVLTHCTWSRGGHATRLTVTNDRVVFYLSTQA